MDHSSLLAPKWQFKRYAPEVWDMMEDEMQDMLEDLYGEFLEHGAEKIGLPVIALGKCEYEFDFAQMRQTNMRSGRARDIRRFLPANEETGFSSPSRMKSATSSVSNGFSSPLRTEFRTAFEMFCGQHSRMDNKSFAKLCRDCSLLDSKFRDRDADVVFASVVLHGQRRISLQQFEMAMREIGRRKHIDFASICDALAFCPGPTLIGTHMEPVRFYDDRPSKFSDLSQRSYLPASPNSSFAVNSPRSSLAADNSMRSSSPRSPRGPRQRSPGPGAYNNPSKIERRVTGGTMPTAKRQFDVHQGAKKERECSPEPNWVLTKPNKVRGGGYFGTGHVSSVHAAGPGPGSYTPARIERRVTGGVIPRQVGHDLELEHAI